MAVNEQANVDELLLNGSLLALTFSTGLVDAASLLALGHVFIANMTGNVVFMAFALAGVHGQSFVPSVIALLSALVGAALAGHMDRRLVWKRRNTWLSAAFAVEAIAVTLALSVLCFSRGRPIQSLAVNSTIFLMGFGIGVRNGTVRRLAVPDLNTTVLTLTVAGLAFDSLIAGGDRIRWRRRVGSIVMMFVGAATGAVLLRHSIALVLGGAALVAASCALVQIVRNETEHEAKLDAGPRTLAAQRSSLVEKA